MTTLPFIFNDHAGFEPRVRRRASVVGCQARDSESTVPAIRPETGVDQNAAPCSAVALAPVGSPEEILQTVVPRTMSRRILIADDDAMVRGSLAALLESEGYVVDEAGDGREAVAHAAARKPDLVLLDLNMPNWDGWTAFSQMDRIAPLLPVIVITARPNQYEKAVRLGVDAFMEKPLNIPLLMCAVRQYSMEDSERRMRRITNRGFVTKLLNGSFK